MVFDKNMLIFMAGALYAAAVVVSWTLMLHLIQTSASSRTVKLLTAIMTVIPFVMLWAVGPVVVQVTGVVDSNVHIILEFIGQLAGTFGAILLMIGMHPWYTGRYTWMERLVASTCSVVLSVMLTSTISLVILRGYF